MDRKSPYRHPVKQHTREGKLVHRYERGKGRKPKPAAKPIGSIGGGYSASADGRRLPGSYTSIEAAIIAASPGATAVEVTRR